MKKTQLFLIAISLIVLLLIGIILWFIIKNPQTEDPFPRRGDPISTPTTLNSRDFQITAILPTENVNGAYSALEKITVRFNKPMYPEDITVSVSPNIDLAKKTGDSPSEMIISPAPPSFWQPDVIYTITIQKSSQAIDGSVLQNPKKYQIRSKVREGGI